MAGPRKTDYTEKFWPQDNPFKVSIAKILPPKTPEGSAPVDAFLIKLKCLVSYPVDSDVDRDLFFDLIKNLENRKSFCGVWTPEVSEPYLDSGEASVELTSYIRRGMEEQILHLDFVARASFEKKPAEAEDEVLVEQFINQLRKGNSVTEAVAKAEKDTRELISRGRKAEAEAETQHLPAPRLETAKVKMHKPPPGPSLGKTVPPGPALPQVERAEELPPPNEVLEALQLVSKEKDAELDTHTESELEISIDQGKKKDEVKKKDAPDSQP